MSGRCPEAQKRASQYSMFGRVVAYVAIGAIIASYVYGSIFPILLAGAGLFCMLRFMNGLS